jgi:hypothetical protein
MLTLSSGILRFTPSFPDMHLLVAMAFMLILGVQITFTGMFARVYSRMNGILPRSGQFERSIRRLTLEKLLVASLALGAAGAADLASVFMDLYAADTGTADYRTLRQLIPALTMITVACQGAFNGFMLSILFLKLNTSDKTP